VGADCDCCVVAAYVLGQQFYADFVGIFASEAQRVPYCRHGDVGVVAGLDGDGLRGGVTE